MTGLGLIVAAAVALGLASGASAARAADDGTLHAQWTKAAKVTAHTAAVRAFCVHHEGNNHYWREGFCTGDHGRYPFLGTVEAPPGYVVCYVRDQVLAGELARIALASGVPPRQHLKGCS